MSLLKSKKKKFGRKANVIGFLCITVCFAFTCFLFIDSFTLYWFMLFAQDDNNEERLKEDFSWYVSFIDRNDSNSSPSDNQNNNQSNDNLFSGGSYGYEPIGGDTGAILDGMSYEEMQKNEAWQRCLIYLMDSKGYVPNATIGFLAYILCEGSAMGTYTYESYWFVRGPSGVPLDTVKDNNAWYKWMQSPNGVGYLKAHEIYDKYDWGNYAAIGIGLVQYSNVWPSKDNLGTANANNLIEAANEAGTYWQDPIFQMDYILRDMEQPYRWDLNQNPGPDPKSSTSVSATEWCARVTYGLGMPSYSWVVQANKNTEYYQEHIAQVGRATLLYEKYSGTDPWFYKPIEDSINLDSYSQNVVRLSWHNPFEGEAYDNSTAIGRLLARTAILMASETKIKFVGVKDAQTINDINLRSSVELKYYRFAVCVAADFTYWASCDRGVSTVIRLSGVDPEFTIGTCTSQKSYLAGSGLAQWEYLGKVKNMKGSLQPGDIIYKEADDGTDGYKHVMMWIGENIAGEKYPGTSANLYEASVNSYYPRVRRATLSEMAEWHVYRCYKSDYSDMYYTKLISEYRSIFMELPSKYCPVK